MAKHATREQRQEVYAYCRRHPDKSLSQVVAHFKKKGLALTEMWVSRNTAKLDKERAVLQLPAEYVDKMPPAPMPLEIPPGHADMETLALSDCLLVGQRLVKGLDYDEQQRRRLIRILSKQLNESDEADPEVACVLRDALRAGDYDKKYATLVRAVVNVSEQLTALRATVTIEDAPIRMPEPGFDPEELSDEELEKLAYGK